VKAGSTEWQISDSPEKGKWYMLSGSAGSCCPADPGARASTRNHSGDWMFRDGLGYTEGGVSVECRAHKMQMEPLKMELVTLGPTVTEPEEQAVTAPPSSPSSPPVANVAPNNASDLSPSPPPKERLSRPHNLTMAGARGHSAPPFSRTPSGSVAPEVIKLLNDILEEEIPRPHRQGMILFPLAYK
jgi:hypothetical protein